MTSRRTNDTVGQRSIARLAAIAAVALVMVTSLVLGSSAVVAGASATTAARPAAPAVSGASFLQSINDLRSSNGLEGLRGSSQLDTVAQRWCERMAAAGRISHNPNLAAEVGPDGWSLLGENVGVGYDVPGLMNAFIASPSHYVNLVNSTYDLVGVGEVVTPEGRLYTVHVFQAEDSRPPAAPTAPTAPTAPQVQVTHTTGRALAAAPTPAAAATPPPPALTPKPKPTPTPTPVRVAAVLDVLRTLDPAA